MKSWYKLILVFSLVLIGVAACSKDGKHKIKKNHRQSVGFSAVDLLSEKKYKSVKVEIVYMTGYKPTDEAVSNLKDFIIARCNKPKGVTITYTEIAARNEEIYHINMIKPLENEVRTEFTSRTELAVMFLFVDGYSEEDSFPPYGNVLGKAYYNTSAVIFGKSVEIYSGGPNEPERYKLETVIMNHEFGHMIGLVNAGAPKQTNHEGTTFKKHCTNSSCLMHHYMEHGSGFANIAGSNPIPTLDADCIIDLQAKGGK